MGGVSSSVLCFVVVCDIVLSAWRPGKMLGLFLRVFRRVATIQEVCWRQCVGSEGRERYWRGIGKKVIVDFFEIMDGS